LCLPALEELSPVRRESIARRTPITSDTRTKAAVPRRKKLPVNAFKVLTPKDSL